jgi:hypothetical protein
MSTSHPTPATNAACDSSVFCPRREPETPYTGDALTVLTDHRDASVDHMATSPGHLALWSAIG